MEVCQSIQGPYSGTGCKIVGQVVLVKQGDKKVFLLTMGIILAIMRSMYEEEIPVKEAIEDGDKINTSRQSI
jgi:hypothetical protein